MLNRLFNSLHGGPAAESSSPRHVPRNPFDLPQNPNHDPSIPPGDDPWPNTPMAMGQAGSPRYSSAGSYEVVGTPDLLSSHSSMSVISFQDADDVLAPPTDTTMQPHDLEATHAVRPATHTQPRHAPAGAATTPFGMVAHLLGGDMVHGSPASSAVPTRSGTPDSAFADRILNDHLLPSRNLATLTTTTTIAPALIKPTAIRLASPEHSSTPTASDASPPIATSRYLLGWLRTAELPPAHPATADEPLPAPAPAPVPTVTSASPPLSALQPVITAATAASPPEGEEGWEMGGPASPMPQVTVAAAPAAAPALARTTCTVAGALRRRLGLCRVRSLPLLGAEVAAAGAGAVRVDGKAVAVEEGEEKEQECEALREERDELADKLLSTDAALAEETMRRRRADAEAASQRALVQQLLAAQYMGSPLARSVDHLATGTPTATATTTTAPEADYDDDDNDDEEDDDDIPEDDQLMIGRVCGFDCLLTTLCLVLTQLVSGCQGAWARSPKAVVAVVVAVAATVTAVVVAVLLLGAGGTPMQVGAGAGAGGVNAGNAGLVHMGRHLACTAQPAVLHSSPARRSSRPAPAAAFPLASEAGACRAGRSSAPAAPSTATPSTTVGAGSSPPSATCQLAVPALSSPPKARFPLAAIPVPTPAPPATPPPAPAGCGAACPALPALRGIGLPPSSPPGKPPAPTCLGSSTPAPAAPKPQPSPAAPLTQTDTAPHARFLPCTATNTASNVTCHGNSSQLGQVWYAAIPTLPRVIAAMPIPTHNRTTAATPLSSITLNTANRRAVARARAGLPSAPAGRAASPRTPVGKGKGDEKVARGADMRQDVAGGEGRDDMGAQLSTQHMMLVAREMMLESQLRVVRALLQDLEGAMKRAGRMPVNAAPHESGSYMPMNDAPPEQTPSTKQAAATPSSSPPPQVVLVQQAGHPPAPPPALAPPATLALTLTPSHPTRPRSTAANTTHSPAAAAKAQPLTPPPCKAGWSRPVPAMALRPVATKSVAPKPAAALLAPVKAMGIMGWWQPKAGSQPNASATATPPASNATTVTHTAPIRAPSPPVPQGCPVHALPSLAATLCRKCLGWVPAPLALPPCATPSYNQFLALTNSAKATANLLSGLPKPPSLPAPSGGAAVALMAATAQSAASPVALFSVSASSGLAWTFGGLGSRPCGCAGAAASVASNTSRKAVGGSRLRGLARSVGQQLAAAARRVPARLAVVHSTVWTSQARLLALYKQGYLARNMTNGGCTSRPTQRSRAPAAAAAALPRQHTNCTRSTGTAFGRPAWALSRSGPTKSLLRRAAARLAGLRAARCPTASNRTSRQPAAPCSRQLQQQYWLLKPWWGLLAGSNSSRWAAPLPAPTPVALSVEEAFQEPAPPAGMVRKTWVGGWFMNKPCASKVQHVNSTQQPAPAWKQLVAGLMASTVQPAALPASRSASQLALVQAVQALPIQAVPVQATNSTQRRAQYLAPAGLAWWMLKASACGPACSRPAPQFNSSTKPASLSAAQHHAPCLMIATPPVTLTPTPVHKRSCAQLSSNTTRPATLALPPTPPRHTTKPARRTRPAAIALPLALQRTSALRAYRTAQAATLLATPPPPAPTPSCTVASWPIQLDTVLSVPPAPPASAHGVQHHLRSLSDALHTGKRRLFWMRGQITICAKPLHRWSHLCEQVAQRLGEAVASSEVVAGPEAEESLYAQSVLLWDQVAYTSKLVKKADRQQEGFRADVRKLQKAVRKAMSTGAAPCTRTTTSHTNATLSSLWWLPAPAPSPCACNKRAWRTVASRARSVHVRLLRATTAAANAARAAEGSLSLLPRVQGLQDSLETRLVWLQLDQGCGASAAKARSRRADCQLLQQLQRDVQGELRVQLDAVERGVRGVLAVVDAWYAQAEDALPWVTHLRNSL